MIERELVRHALRAVPNWEQWPLQQFNVLAANTHLVVGCEVAAGHSLIIKFWRNERKQPVDTFVHRQLAGKLPVPRVLGIGHVRMPATAVLTPRFRVERGELVPFTAYETLAGAGTAEQWLSSWSQPIRERAFHQAGQWLQLLHASHQFERSGPLVPFASGWQGSADGWYNYAVEQLEVADRQLQAQIVPRADRRLRRQVRGWLDQVLAEISNVERFVLCHRDYSFRNLMATREGALVGVIDFEHAIAGDPIFDLHRFAAQLWPSTQTADRQYWTAFVTGYGGPLSAEVKRRLLIYLAVYAVTSFGYALKEQDQQFYEQSRDLLQWLVAYRISA